MPSTFTSARAGTLWVKPLLGMLTSVVLAGALAQPALAQDKGHREREALRRTQQALRAAQQEAATLQQDKAALDAEKARLLSDKQAAETSSRAQASRVAGAQAQARAAQARVSELEAELQRVKDELASAQDKQAAQAAELAEQQRTLAAVRTRLERSTQAQVVLEKRNQQLYQVGRDAIELYRSDRPKETLARLEPFAGIGRVTLDNVAERWMDRLEAARWLEQERMSP